MTAPRRFSDAAHPYSSARAAGGLLFVAGQLGVVNGEMVQGGVVPQTRQALANLEATLDSHGLALADLVKITVYLVDMADRTALDEAYAAALPEPLPARTCVAVAELPFSARVELDAVAALPTATTWDAG